MPVEFEDTVAGGTDISGAPPPPVQTPAHLRAQTQGAVSRGGRQPRPQPAPEAPPQPEPTDSASTEGTPRPSKGGPAGDVYGALTPPQTASGVRMNPLAPLDWEEGAKVDLPTVFHASRATAAHLGAFLQGTGLSELPSDAYRRVTAVWNAAVDPNAISASVQNIWQQDSAQAAVAKYLLSGGASVIPGLNQQQVEANTAQAFSGLLPMTANPLNAIGAGGEVSAGYRAAAILGPMAAQALLSSDPNERASGLTWMGITASLLTAGHLPAGAREYLAKALGRWPELEGHLSGLMAARQDYGRKIADPTSTHIEDHLQRSLQQGLFPGAAKTLAENPIGAGEHVVRQKAIKDVLSAAGVGSWSDLVQRAHSRGIGGKAAIKALTDNWKELGQGYVLKQVTPGDMPPLDPRRMLREIHNSGDAELSRKAHAYLMATNHWMDEARRGPFATSEDPTTSMWRSLIGLNRTLDWVDQAHGTAVLDLANHAKLGRHGEDITRALEGDRAAYDKLPDAAKLIVAGEQHRTNDLRRIRLEIGHPGAAVGNFVPRIDKVEQGAPAPLQRGARSSSALAREFDRHRPLAIRADDEGRLHVTQHFATVHEANQALADYRARIVGALTDPAKSVPDEIASEPDVQALRQAAAAGQDVSAEAAAFATRWSPSKETDYFKILARRPYLAQARALQTYQALKHWEQTPIFAEGKWTRNGGHPNQIAARRPTSQREREQLMRQGYRHVKSSGAFDEYLFAPRLADLLDRATSHVSDYLNAGSGSAAAKAFAKSLDLERDAVGLIMWSPATHFWNMAQRLGMVWLQHPMAMTHYLLNRKALLPHQVDEASFALRQEAYNAGLIPPHANRSYGAQLQGLTGDVLGDTLGDLPDASQDARLSLGVRDRLRNNPLSRLQRMANNYFWGAVNDFGVMSYHLHKQALLDKGYSEEAARLVAARLANSAVGHVAPEDTNPLLHDLGRLALFAPNFWRTWGELMAPWAFKSYSRDLGVPMDARLRSHLAFQGAKNAMALFALQKMAGQVLNVALSGHTQGPIFGQPIVMPWAAPGQTENLPGNQDRFEATAPYLDPIFGPGTDPRTGARRTIENPLGRFARDMEEIAGFQSGQPDWRPSYAEDGAAKFFAARFSPIMESISSLANVDLYRTLTTRSLRAADPTSEPLHPTPASALISMAYMSPFGLPFSAAVQKALDANQDPMTLVPGPFGTRVPRAVRDVVAGAKDTTSQVLGSWLTGVNPPFAYSQKTAGTQPTDAQYRQVREAKATYDQQMQTLSAEALGGQITPAEWVQRYRAIHQPYVDTVRSVYHDAPEYVNGAEGMLNQYEALYDQAQAPDGSIDYAKLDRLQAQFRSDPRHVPHLAEMDALMHQTDATYPMLALYHKTLDAYRRFQDDWAAQNGVDAAQLRSEISEYGRLYGDARGSAVYLQQHRELARYEAAKRRQWEQSPAGLMWSLFYNPAAAATYMRARHLTAQQVEQEAASA